MKKKEEERKRKKKKQKKEGGGREAGLLEPTHPQTTVQSSSFQTGSVQRSPIQFASYVHVQWTTTAMHLE